MALTHLARLLPSPLQRLAPLSQFQHSGVPALVTALTGQLSHLQHSASFSTKTVKVSAESAEERRIAEKLAGSLQGCTEVTVIDTSGGCGAMYQIQVVASDFKGLTKIKQHKLVQTALAEDIAQWHGLVLVTKAE